MNDMRYTASLSWGHWVGWLALLALLGPAAEAAAQRAGARRALRYEVVDLCAGSEQACGAQGVDAQGTVVGWTATAEGKQRAMSWARDGETRELALLQNGTYSFASAISGNGVWIAGSGGIRPLVDPHLFRDIEQGFAWTDGVTKPVGALYNPATVNRRFGTSAAYAVNDRGQVVGLSNVLRQNLQSAFLWQDGVMTDLGRANETVLNSRAFDINDSGLIVGDVATGGPVIGPAEACVWQAGELRRLPQLNGYAASTAVAVNASGQVAGWAQNETVTVAVRWTREQPEGLGTLPGDESSQALDINAAGHVVGWSGSASDARACLWSGGTVTDLNALLPIDTDWILLEAAAINDRGMIVGSGLKAGQPRAFLLVPQACARR